MKAVRLVGLAACLGAVAACSDLPTTTTQGPDKARLAMSAAARDTALRLADLANTAESNGNIYRQLLLRAMVDVLQFGVPMTTASIDLGDGAGTRNFTAVAMDAVLTTGDSAAFVMAWRGTDADTLVVISAPYDGENNALGDTLGFYLQGIQSSGADTPWIAEVSQTSSTTVSFGSIGAQCPKDVPTGQPAPNDFTWYDDRAGLNPPAATACNDHPVTASFSMNFYANNDRNTTAKTISMGTKSFTGVRVVRPPLSSSIAKVRELLGGL